MIVFAYTAVGVTSLLTAYIVYMIIIAIVPGIKAAQQDLNIKETSDKVLPDLYAHREEISFNVQGDTVNGFIYLPKDAQAPSPCIILAHGLGGTIDCGLDQYAVG